MPRGSAKYMNEAIKYFKPVFCRIFKLQMNADPFFQAEQKYSELIIT